MSRPDLSPAAVEARNAHFFETYSRSSFHPRSGKGATLVDAGGKVYTDLLAGIAVNALGVAHPRLVKAWKEESRSAWHVSNLFFSHWQGLLAEKLVALSGLTRVFFTNSGTEATEAALKIARRRNPGRSRVIALSESFHGRTFGALSITGNEAYRAPFEPLVPGAVFLPPNDVAALEAAVTPDTSAIFLEPVLGEAGILPLTHEYLRAARRLADATGACLVLDEIQCGLGRTGHLFAFQESGVVPDMVTLAKPLGGGLPLGAVVGGPAVASLLSPGQHGTTFGGNPVACRLGYELLCEMEERELVREVAALGEWFGKKLAALAKRSPHVLGVRGQGLMWGIDIDREAVPFQRRLLGKGFVVGTSRKTTLRLLPPYVIRKSALSAFVNVLAETLADKAEETP